MTTTEFLDSMRSLKDDHEPDGWPAIQMRDVTRLVEIIDGLVPVLDRLEEWFAKGAYIDRPDGTRWVLLDKNHKPIVSGRSIFSMLAELIFHEET